VGREDLVPCDALWLPSEPRVPAVDYAAVFEEHPVIGGALRALVYAIQNFHVPKPVVAPRVRHRASAPTILLSPIGVDVNAPREKYRRESSEDIKKHIPKMLVAKGEVGSVMTI